MQKVRGKTDPRTGRRIVIDLQKAERALKDGRHREVEEICTEILEESPGHVYALQVLAELRLKENRTEDAVRAVEEAKAGEPDNARTTNLLGRIEDLGGRPEAAEALFRRAAELAPDYPDAHANLGDVLRRAGRLEEAEAEFRQAIRFDAEHGLANLSLGAMLYHRGLPDQAVPHLQAGLKREMANRDGQYLLAICLHELGRMDEAITAYRRLVATGDTDPDAFSHLAEALAATGEWEGASAGFEAALEIEPGHGGAAAGLAGVLEASGQPGAAMRLLAPRLKSGDSPPEVRVAYARLLARQGRSDEALVQLARVIDEPGTTRQATLAHTLVGDILDARGHYERAFAHYRRASALTGGHYDPAEREREVGRLIEVLTPETIDAIPRGSESELPVFVVGMPRSGTSVVEAILAAHSRGSGVGALPHIGLAAGRIGRYNKAGVPYPECVSLLIRKDVQELASGYLVKLLAEHERARRVADRMWQNFDHLGFIEILFPHARVIHCRRDPLDTGLSCFGHAFGMTGAEFCTDLANLGHYYGQYRRLADHWKARSRLRTLEVDYEALVGDPETEARRVLDFLELPWEPACIGSAGPAPRLAAAQAEDARPAIYTSSVGRARHYEAWLGPLKEALAAAGYPPADPSPE